MSKPEFIDLTKVPFFAQLDSKEEGPVVLINMFDVPHEVAEAFEAYWQVDASYMKAQPGLLSTQFHKGIAGNGMYVNVAHWESAADLAKAFHSEDFQKGISRMPSGVKLYPMVTKKMAVPGVCAA